MSWSADWAGWQMYAALGVAFAALHFHLMEKMYFNEIASLRYGLGWCDASIDPARPGRYEIVNGWAWNPRLSEADFSAIGFWVKDAATIARSVIAEDGGPIPLMAVRRWRRR